jgi:hypothetical protein
MDAEKWISWAGMRAFAACEWWHQMGMRASAKAEGSPVLFL